MEVLEIEEELSMDQALLYLEVQRSYNAWTANDISPQSYHSRPASYTKFI